MKNHHNNSSFSVKAKLSGTQKASGFLELGYLDFFETGRSCLATSFSGEKRSVGQINLEFIVFIGIMMFILVVASFAALVASSGVAEDNEIADARRLAFVVASEVNLAAEIGDGYTHTFELPKTIYNGRNYTVVFDETRFVSVHWRNRTYSLPVLAQNTSGIIKTGDVIISNKGGVIYFE